ncbi:BrnT family toxin [Candidatus Binatus sp.]|uniref:BrnT family toxin n=1 Tax=Candidatus Binatus sp. TaxID=2811406 RepID=UPI00351DA015
MPFEWDEAKDRTNLAKHGIDFDEAIHIFDGPVLEIVDARRDYGETRILAIGLASGREISLVYTWRGPNRRIITARRAHAIERRAYRQAFATADRQRED